MWEEQKRERFRQLRLHQENNALTPAEEQELAALIEEIEAGEAAYLTPATERLRQEQEALEGQNRALEVLARRKEELVRRLRNAVIREE